MNAMYGTIFITALVVLRGPGVEGRNLPGPVP